MQLLENNLFFIFFFFFKKTLHDKQTQKNNVIITIPAVMERDAKLRKLKTELRAAQKVSTVMHFLKNGLHF